MRVRHIPNIPYDQGLNNNMPVRAFVPKPVSESVVTLGLIETETGRSLKMAIDIGQVA